MDELSESIELVKLNPNNEPEKYASVKQPLYSSEKASFRSRQPSVNTAKRNWSKVKRSVLERSETQMSTTEKWLNLTRSMSQNVGEFFGVSGEVDVQQSREPSSEKWRARSRRLHNNNIIFNRTIKKKTQHGALVPVSSPTSTFQSTMPSIDIDANIGPQSYPFDKWTHKPMPHPVDPFAKMNSRQLSAMSTTSSKRVQRLQSSRTQIQKDSFFKMAANRFSSEKRVIPKRSFSQAAKMTPIACFPEETIEEDFFKECLPTSPPTNRRLLQIPKASYSAYNSLESYDAIDASDYGSLHVHSFEAIPPITRQNFQQEKRSRFEIPENILKQYLNREKRPVKSKRKFGIGLVGQLFGNEYKVTPMNKVDIESTSNFTDYRPYFTYWVTFVQIVVCIFTVSVYGITYHGISRTLVDGEVRRNNLAIEKVHYLEQENMWLGPRQADLIHLGARYSPCMRRDLNVFENIEKDRAMEKLSGCCLFNDGSGCVQIIEGKCPRTLASWINGTVCGQDPRFCKNSLIPAALWSREDITLWPVCKSKVRKKKKVPTATLR